MPASLRWTRALAFAALCLEAVWPVVFGLAGLAAVFLILSWFGLFSAIPGLARIAILVVLAACGLGWIWRHRRIAWPRRSHVDARIEAASRLTHQPLRAQDDRVRSDDPFAAALWREHQRRMRARLSDLAGGVVNTRTERLDPWGLRAVVALLLVTAFAFSYGPNGGRVGDAVATAAGPLGPQARVDAWVTPPAYTGRAPIFLAGSEGEDRSGSTVNVPTGSTLSVRVSQGSGAGLVFTPGEGESQVIEPVGREDDADEAAADGAGQEDAGATGSGAESAQGAPREYAVTLTESGRAELATRFSTLGDWAFDVIPDRAPMIRFLEAPSEARNGALQLSYAVADDYGVRTANAEIAVEDDLVADGARPLIAPPTIDLSIPRTRNDEPAEGRTSAELTESPYAGAQVALTLTATDAAEQVGRSNPQSLTLPERRFAKPLARAVVEQRRILALDARTVPRVVDMLDAVTLRGEDYIDDASTYLALRAVRSRIANARADEELVSAVDFMWDIALGIEDGDLSLAERRLRDARERLSEALEEGASDAEIDRLMQELRQAMQEYMQALAEQMRDQPMNQMQMGDAQELRPQDLDRMMDRIEDLAKSGSKDAAQQLLSELQSMMDNLQAMRPGQQQQGQQGPMQEQMNKMGELLQRQQSLMDETYDLGRQRLQQQRRQGQQNQPGQQPGEEGQSGQPMTPDRMREMMEDLQRQQGQLQQELDEMREAMEGMGMEPSEGFGEAGEAMENAEGALGQGRDGEAVGEQGRAMEAMRRGAEDMMNQMQQAMGQGQGQGGQGQQGPGFNGQPQQSGRDPLGRERQTQGPQFGQDVGVPDEIDAQRAREILEAIRERLGDQLSPKLERDYLERLLDMP